MSRTRGEESYFLDEDVFNVLLQKSGLTLNQIAKISGYGSASSISALLKGETKPSIVRAKKMADKLGCRLDVLLISPDRVSKSKLDLYTARLNRIRELRSGEKQPAPVADEGKKIKPEDKKDYKRMLAEFQQLGQQLTEILYGDEEEKGL